MSSASTGGPPGNQPWSSNGEAPTGNFDFKKGSSSALRGTDRVFLHIDDLTAARPDVNIHSPMRTLLTQCESHAKQAETRLDFGRPDLALEEYMRASVLLVEIITRHKDYPQLKSDRGDLHRLFGGLQKRINVLHPKFEEIKGIIKENNELNAVAPKVKNGQPTLRSGQIMASKAQNESLAPFRTEQDGSVVDNLGGERLHSSSNGPSTSQPNYLHPAARKKPVVQPKPDALHGKAIKSVESSAPASLNKADEDLAARFARLRSSDLKVSDIMQDPRIRTQPIQLQGNLNATKGAVPTLPTFNSRPNSYQRPSGPRDMSQAIGTPRSPRSSLDTSIPSMPKPPDAIYSPARNFDNPANLEMPRTTPRSTFSSAARPQSNSTTMSFGLDNKTNRSGNLISGSGIEAGTDYFGLSSFTSNDAPSKPTTKKKLPNSTIITAEELMNYLKETRILLVDIRAREDFDSGHIMSQNILCIEPIILRKDISAEELAQSLVLSPETEQRLFNERATFDLIIFYDINSSDLRSNPNNYGHETALQDFSRAVYDYGYEKRSKQRPLLLKGGLESWIDLLGQGSLQTSMALRGSSRPARIQVKGAAPRKAPRVERPTYKSRPLSKEEEHKWEQAIKNETLQSDDILGSPSEVRDGLANESYFVRTTEDFVRRYPEASAIPESMSSPVYRHDQSAHIAATRRDELNSMTPKIPTRPPPALPRQSYTGVADRDPGAVTTIYKQASTAIGPTNVNTISRPEGSANHCGLYNAGAMCYMNAIFQCLSCTIPFARWLTTYDFLDPAQQAPGKRNETSNPHPQLMTKNLANLFRHLWSQRWSYVNPATLRSYIHAVSKADKIEIKQSRTALGTLHQQQDAQEFLDFLLNIVEDETNMRRNVKEINPSELVEKARNKAPAIVAAHESWQDHIKTQNSPVFTDLFGTGTMQTVTCKVCSSTSRTFNGAKYLLIDIPNQKAPETLISCLERTYGVEDVEGFTCGECGGKGTSKQSQLTHAPKILILALSRTGVNSDGVPEKVRTPITFHEELDMSPYFIDFSNATQVEKQRTIQTRPPFKYRCYAVVQHTNSSDKAADALRSGHYFTIAKDRGSSTKQDGWIEFNDSALSKSSWSKTQDPSSYVLFYERQDYIIQS